MEDFIKNISHLLSGYNVTQKLCIYVIFATTFSVCLSSLSPVICLFVTLILSWVLVQAVHRLPYHIPEKYIFKFLDTVDKIEIIVKKIIAKKSTPPTRLKSTSLGNRDIFGAPENEARICIHYIVRDFINSWYKEYISSENQPIEEAQEILEQLTIQMFDRLRTVNVIAFVKLVIVRFQKHVSDYIKAQEHWKQQPYLRNKRKGSPSEFKKIKSLVSSFKVLFIDTSLFTFFVN